MSDNDNISKSRAFDTIEKELRYRKSQGRDSYPASANQEKSGAESIEKSYHYIRRAIYQQKNNQNQTGLEMGVTPNVAFSYKELEEDFDEVSSRISSPIPNMFPMKPINNGEMVPRPDEDDSSVEDEDENDDFQIVSIEKMEEETFWSVSIQIFIPFLIAGLGMVGAGLILDVVQHWVVFIEVPEVFILVPALLGLKGNLEMTLASRLSTQANLGNLDNSQAKWNSAVGNLSLVQCQAIVVGFLASVAAVILGWIPSGKFNMNHFLILCSSAVATASLASLVLSTIMVGIVILSRNLRVNPDNVATPIAASLGDLTTLSVLAFISNSIFNAIDTHPWIVPLILGFYLISMPVWIILAKGNSLTRRVLYTGWSPVLSAMVISSFGGLILDFTVKTFNGIAVFQPVISGVGGNLVAVQASRISTALHKHASLGKLPDRVSGLCTNPLQTFCSNGIQSVTARALILMTAPGHLIFLLFLQAGHGHTSFTPVFLIFYLLAALIQVIVLLYIADILIKVLWTRKVDPDNSAIPYLTALGDLIGTGLLALAFILLFWIGDRDQDVGD